MNKLQVVTDKCMLYCINVNLKNIFSKYSIFFFFFLGIRINMIQSLDNNLVILWYLVFIKS